MATILVADDSPVQLLTCRHILAGNGHEVYTAGNGRDAWETLQTGEFDLLISDIMMPDMDGFELLARVRETSALHELPVVLLTGLAEEEQALSQRATGASTVLSKPVSSWALIDAVTELLPTN